MSATGLRQVRRALLAARAPMPRLLDAIDPADREAIMGGLRQAATGEGGTSTDVWKGGSEAWPDDRYPIFGKTGNFGWQEVCDLTIENAAHAPYLIDKLWLFFVGVPATAGRRAQLVKIYRDSKTDLRPVLREVLGAPELYASLDRPAMIKWPAVYVAGLLRQTQSRVTDQYWTWTLSEMGQTLFNPPSVAGWDTGLASMSSNTMKARFEAVSSLMADQSLHVGVRAASIKPGLSAKQHFALAQRATSSPWTSAKTEKELLALAQKILRTVKPGAQRQYAKERGAQVQSALRHILLSGPDAQLH